MGEGERLDLGSANSLTGWDTGCKKKKSLTEGLKLQQMDEVFREEEEKSIKGYIENVLR